MKIVCDVCSKEEAVVFCCADEAALCGACDRRVHHANKLAGKHRRLSLSAPSQQCPQPLCDICQEKRGFLFCQEDRAILCRDCDAAVHNANHLTKKHNRFILTGVRISAAPISSSDSGETEEITDKAKASPTVPATNQNNSANTAPKASAATVTTPKSGTAAGSINQKRSLIPESNFTKVNDNIRTPTSSVSNPNSTASASSISEYLMKTCPGWHVEDLLVDDAAAALGGFYKVDELLPFLEADLYGEGLEAVVAELPQVWAPEVPQFPAGGLPMASAAGTVADAAHHQACTAAAAVVKEVGASYHQIGEAAAERDRWSENALMVPEILPVATSGKRAKHSAWYY